MKVKSRLYNTIIKILSQHKKWLDVRHKFTLAWMASTGRGSSRLPIVSGEPGQKGYNLVLTVMLAEDIDETSIEICLFPVLQRDNFYSAGCSQLSAIRSHLHHDPRRSHFLGQLHSQVAYAFVLILWFRRLSRHDLELGIFWLYNLKGQVCLILR